MIIKNVRQDGTGTDERVLRPLGRIARLATMRTRTRIVLRTLLVADVWLLLVTGSLIALYMERPAGWFFAGFCWALAALLLCAPRLVHWIARRRR